MEQDVVQHWRLLDRLRRPKAVSHDLSHDPSGLPPPLALVHVRHFLVNHQSGTQLHFLDRDIRVGVVGNDDRKVRSQLAPEPAQDLGVGVGMALRHHRSVQSQQQAVDPSRALHSFDQLASQSFERLVCDRSRGCRVRDERGNEFEPVLAGTGNKPAYFVSGVAELGFDFVASASRPTAECIQACQPSAEGV